MKKVVVIAIAMSFGVYMFGCGKKQAAMEETQEPMSMESLSITNTSAQTKPEMKPEVKPAEVAEAKTQTAQTQASTQSAQTAKLEPLPPAGPYKPTSIQIQTALKNAGFYTGEVDGKIGAKTKKAIEDFQKANNLKADGKVGPKTWEALSKYLNQEAAAKPASTKKKR